MINQHEEKRPVLVCDCGEHAWLSLTRGFVTFISPTDADFVGRWSWTTLFKEGRKPRAVRRENGDGKMRYLHREIMESNGANVDHFDRDTLNNRRGNLRPCSQMQNTWNSGRKRYGKTSKFKGVTRCKTTGRWCADIRADKRYRLGRFNTEEEAAKAYDQKAVELHGEFATTNQSLGLIP